jgi:hypothetical protein
MPAQAAAQRQNIILFLTNARAATPDVTPIMTALRARGAQARDERSVGAAGLSGRKYGQADEDRAR